MLAARRANVGEVYFECPNNGRVGYLYVITTRLHDPSSPIGTWGVPVLVGFTATRARAGEGFAIARHMAFSVSPNPQWYAGILQIAQQQNNQQASPIRGNIGKRSPILPKRDRVGTSGARQ